MEEAQKQLEEEGDEETVLFLVHLGVHARASGFLLEQVACNGLFLYLYILDQAVCATCVSEWSDLTLASPPFPFCVTHKEMTFSSPDMRGLLAVQQPICSNSPFQNELSCGANLQVPNVVGPLLPTVTIFC